MLIKSNQPTKKKTQQTQHTHTQTETVTDRQTNSKEETKVNHKTKVRKQRSCSLYMRCNDKNKQIYSQPILNDTWAQHFLNALDFNEDNIIHWRLKSK